MSAGRSLTTNFSQGYLISLAHHDIGQKTQILTCALCSTSMTIQTSEAQNNHGIFGLVDQFAPYKIWRGLKAELNDPVSKYLVWRMMLAGMQFNKQ